MGFVVFLDEIVERAFAHEAFVFGAVGGGIFVIGDVVVDEFEEGFSVGVDEAGSVIFEADGVAGGVEWEYAVVYAGDGDVEFIIHKSPFAFFLDGA